MMHLHHQEIATFMKNDLKSAVHTGALITSDQSHYIGREVSSVENTQLIVNI